jgi:hypothetical protein
MSTYDNWNFKWWGNGNYEQRLKELRNFWKTKDYSLLCTLATSEVIVPINAPISPNHGHYLLKNNMEVIVYKVPNILPGILTPKIELRLFLNDIYQIKPQSNAHYN